MVRGAFLAMPPLRQRPGWISELPSAVRARPFRSARRVSKGTESWKADAAQPLGLTSGFAWGLWWLTSPVDAVAITH
jgi:hypothetical protein